MAILSGDQGAIDAVRNGAEFASLNRQGEEAILANAAATGGLRGGNTQGALANFRADLLAKLITEQFGRAGQITQVGQNAAGVASSAIGGTANNIAQLLADQGAATAGGQIAKGNAGLNGINSAIGIGSTLASLRVFGAKKPAGPPLAGF